MNRFKTLLQREWMQHQRGWIVLMALPMALVIAAGLLGQVQLDLGKGGPTVAPGPLVFALASIAGVGVVTLALAWMASLLQAPGLARRDAQDRSIEFWLSLPISHTQSLFATLLMHLILVPWLALLVGLGGGFLVSLLLVAQNFGVGAWFMLPWGTMLAAGVGFALRLMLGLLLATLWLSPLILGTMAASAWLRRWGVPLVAGMVGIGGLVLDKVYGQPIVWDVLRTLGMRASQAFLVADRDGARGMTVHNAAEFRAALDALPAWVAADAGHALAALASPAFVGALLASAAAFGLLWLRRQRGA